jgi:peptidoglycan/xylan/chitin deacetylase (PgdA/CDA1 family)
MGTPLVHVKPMSKRLAAALVSRSPLPELVFQFRARGRLTVIMYHSISRLRRPGYPFDDQLVSATPEAFLRQLRFLRSHLDILSVGELLACLRQPQSLPQRPALITFDDGHADNYEVAFPLLRQERLHACFFLATGFIGTSSLPWWDQIFCCFRYTRLAQLRSPFGKEDPPFDLAPAKREFAIARFIRQLRDLPTWGQAVGIVRDLPAATGVTPETLLERPLFMSWKQVRQLAAAGMELGGHTRTHPILSRIADRRVLRDEIAGCADDIQKAVGHVPLAFAYPTGGKEAMSAEADAEIRDSGFRICFSAVHSFATPNAGSVARMPRVRINFGDDFRAFRMALARLPAPAREEGLDR